MSRKDAQRRHAKATRRTKLLKERRLAEAPEAGGGLAGKVRRAASAPIEACYVQAAIADAGIGMVAIARRVDSASLVVGGFLVDAYCLGVKDVFFRDLDEDDWKMFRDGLEVVGPLHAVDPAYARKLVRDAAAYADSLGLAPHPEFAAVEPIFGDVDANACAEAFRFGRDGRPVYIPGPGESATQIRKQLDRLRRRLGDDGFDFEDATEFEAFNDSDEPDDDDLFALEGDEDDEEGHEPYDADVGPDPQRWLARREDARISDVRRYHLGAGIELERPELHAALQTTVENQIAMADETPVRRVLERLMAEGLTRHDALHALMAALTESVKRALDSDVNANDAYDAAIERLTAESWRRSADED